MKIFNLMFVSSLAAGIFTVNAATDINGVTNDRNTIAIGEPHAEDSAVEIGIGGIGPAADAGAVAAVRYEITDALHRGIIDKFIVHGYGIEGGFSACVQSSPFAERQDFKKFVKRLRKIQVDPSTTAYGVEVTDHCAEHVVEPVFCTEDAKICPDGSAVGRVPPSCEFAPCPE